VFYDKIKDMNISTTRFIIYNRDIIEYKMT